MFIPRTLLVTLVVALAAAAALHAQPSPGESAYRLAPAITGHNGRVFVGTQRGTILYATSNPGSIAVTDSATAGGLLPSELQAVWALSMPNRQTSPQLIVGIASYSDGATSRFGAIRSTDFGASWTLIKDAALGDDRFRPSNRFWDTTDLRELTWLPDAQHGWAFGQGGIVATTDGGLTWSVRMTRDPALRNNPQAIAFRDPMNGAGVIGWVTEERFRVTTDGGATWGPVVSPSAPLGLLRATQVDWIGNQYRALLFDRSALSDRGKQTTYISRSTDLGQFWDMKPKGTITVEQTYHTEILWNNARTGFMVMRSGQIAVTQNEGVTWTRVQEADSVGYPQPINTNVGFGYNSILLDNRYIVQASTLRNDGVLDTLVQWDLGTSSVRYAPIGREEAAVVPTPSRDLARLELGRPVAAGGSLTVLDATGAARLVEAAPAGATSVSIDVAGLAPGVYRVVVDEPGRRISAPLVVAR